MCTHILSDVLYNYDSRVRYVLSSPSPCAIKYFSWKILESLKIPPLQNYSFCHSVFLMSFAKIPQSGKCLVPGLVPCQVRRRKIMVPRPVTISHRGSQVNRAVKQHLPKYAAFMSKASSSIKKWWTMLSIWEITVNHTSRIPSCLNYKIHAPQHSLTLIDRLRPMIGVETLKGN